MTTDGRTHDRVAEALALLTTHEPEAIRAARTRTRCHAALGRHTFRPREAGPPRRRRWSRVLEPALVASLSMVYLFEVLSRALHLYRF